MSNQKLKSIHEKIKPTKDFFFGELIPWEEMGVGLNRAIFLPKLNEEV